VTKCWRGSTFKGGKFILLFIYFLVFCNLFVVVYLFICAYIVWAISPPSLPTPLPPSSPLRGGKFMLALGFRTVILWSLGPVVRQHMMAARACGGGKLYLMGARQEREKQAGGRGWDPNNFFRGTHLMTSEPTS
jgi:hypothetical protein